MRRQMFRAMALMSSSSFVVLFFSLVRSKMIAIFLGVAGVGVLGVLQSFFAVGTSIAGIATGGSIVKEMTGLVAKKDPMLKEYKNGLINLSISSSVIVIIGLFLFKSEISKVLNYDLSILDFSVIAAAILFSNLSTLQISWLNSHNVIKEIAFIKTVSAFLALLFSIIILRYFESIALIMMIFFPPVFQFIVGLIYSQKVVLFKNWKWKDGISRASILLQKRVLLIGGFLMLGSLIASVTNIAVRVIIEKRFGITGVGLFQSAWSISMTYIEILLSSISVYFFPQFVISLSNRLKANTLLNEQFKQLQYICTPVILVLIVFSEFVLSILYSNDFSGGANILRWQLIGDLYKVFVWVMGFVLIAHNKLAHSVFFQLGWGISYILSVSLSVELLGVNSAGFGFFGSYFFIFLCYIVYFKRYLKYAVDYESFIYATVCLLLLLPYFFMLRNNYKLYCYSYGGLLIVSSFLFSYKKLFGIKSARL